MKNGFSVSLLTFLIFSCASEDNASVSASHIGEDGTHYFYVDVNGECDGRLPCYTVVQDALYDSFSSQFEEIGYGQFSEALRPDDPPDQIVVMPGDYRSAEGFRAVLGLGISGSDDLNLKGSWKLDIYSEQGPDNTRIVGANINSCLDVYNNIDVQVYGFTFTGCVAAVGQGAQAFAVETDQNADIVIRGNIIEEIFIEDSNPYVAVFGAEPINVPINVTIKVIGNVIRGGPTAITFGGMDRRADNHKLLIANNIIYDNDVGIVFSGIPDSDEIKIEVVHNTIYGNDIGINLSFSNLSLAYDGSVINNIVFGNGIDIYEVPGPPDNNVSNNMVGEDSMLISAGNFLGDPLFVDAAAHDFRLSDVSPAIDLGLETTSADINMDYYGNPRPVDGNNDSTVLPDIGAIEFQPPN